MPVLRITLCYHATKSSNPARAVLKQAGNAVSTTSFEDTYGQVLAEYIRTHSEDALYRASILSQTFIQRGVGPEEIIALHFEQLDKSMEGRTYREQARAIGDAHQFLLEVMIAYGVQYKEYLELRMRESLREAEERTAVEQARVREHELLQQERANLLEQIAHELRTPLTAAMGSLDLAQRSLDRGQIERLPPLIDSARGALDRLSRLTANLVQASRGDMPQLELNPQSLGSLLTEACTWAEPMATAKGVRFIHESEQDDATVLADADAALSIFGNLLANAIRYTPPGGEVLVRQCVNGEMAWIEILDTGIGMSPEVQARIFEKFYRAPEARKLDAQGLGLGLALVKGLVEAHRGTLDFTSAAGSGSTFRVILPMAAAGESALEAAGDRRKER
jgi:signal transduction histidine kinase